MPEPDSFLQGSHRVDPRTSVRALQNRLADARRLCDAGYRRDALAAVDAALSIDPRCLAAQSLRETILTSPVHAPQPSGFGHRRPTTDLPELPGSCESGAPRGPRARQRLLLPRSRRRRRRWRSPTFRPKRTRLARDGPQRPSASQTTCDATCRCILKPSDGQRTGRVTTELPPGSSSVARREADRFGRAQEGPGRIVKWHCRCR